MKRTRDQTKQYTIRNVPPAVDRALRKKARANGKSLNETALDALRVAADVERAPNYDDLDGIIGTWVEDPEFDRALEDQRRIDPDLWR